MENPRKPRIWLGMRAKPGEINQFVGLVTVRAEGCNHVSRGETYSSFTRDWFKQGSVWTKLRARTEGGAKELGASAHFNLYVSLAQRDIGPQARVACCDQLTSSIVRLAELSIMIAWH